MTRLLVAVIYLMSLVTTSAAQVVGAAPRSTKKPVQVENWSPQTANNDLQETLHEQVGAAVKKAEDQQDDTYWVNKGATMVQKECSLQGLPCILGKLFKAEEAANEDVQKAVVCLDDGSECVPALAYGQGAVHYALNNLLYYNGQIIIEYAPNFVELVSNYLVHSEKDRQAAMKYLQQVYNKGDCSFKASELLPPGGWTQSQQADNRMRREARQKRCVVEMSVLPTMAMLAKTQAEKDYVTKKSAKLLDKGAGWVGTAMTALGVLGTQQAYKVVEDYLEDQLPSISGNIMYGIDSPGQATARNSLKEASVARGGNSNFLTRITKEYQYNDPEEMQRQGVRYVARLGGANPYAQGNYLEDVGYMLASQSFTNPYAAALAKRIVAKANQETKAGLKAHDKAADVTYPVIVGILDGWRQGKDKRFIYEPSQELLSFLYKGDWFDLNEATQRRAHYKAYQFAKARGWGWKAPEKDVEKLKRDQANNTVLAVGKSIDIIYQVYMLVGLATLATVKGPQLARGVWSLRTRQGRMLTKDYIRKLPRTLGNKAATKYQNTKQAVKNTAVQAKQTAQQAVNKVSKQKTSAKPVAESATPKAAPQREVVPTRAPVAEQAPAKPVELGPAKGSTPAEPKTEAVSPAKLQEQVTGTLAQRVQEGKSAMQNIKDGANYVGGVVSDYFKALSRPRRTLQMNILGPLGTLVPESGAYSAVRAERKAAEASKAIELAQQEVERTTQIYKQVLRARPSANEGVQAEAIWRAEEETAYMNMAKASENLGRVEAEVARTKQLTQVRQAEQAVTSAPKVATTQQGAITAGVRAEESTLSVTPENYLSAKRVGTNYEVKALDAQGQVFSREMTAAQYRDLQKAARSTGKKESLELRGQRLELQHRRAMRASAQTEVGQAASTQLYQATEKATREIAAQVDEVKRLSSSADRLVSGAKESYSTITKAGADSSAEALYVQLTAQGKEIDRLYVEINDIQRAVKAYKVSSAAEAAEKSAQVAQKTKQIQTLVKEMENASAQLRLLEVNAEVKALGQLRVSAQQKLAKIRSLLQTANAAKIPSAETAQLRNALQQAENVLYSTQGVGREALTLGKEGSFANAVDKAGFAQRKIENAIQNVGSYAKSFQQSWGTELKQASKLTTQKAAQERVAAAQARQAEQARKAEAARRSAEAQKTAELAKQAQTVATPQLSEGAKYLINDGHHLVQQINMLEENIYAYSFIWKQDPKLLQSFDELKQSISILQNMRAGSANATVIEQQLATVRGQLEGVWNTLGHKISVVENSAGRLPTADYAILDEVRSVQDLCGKLLSTM